MQADTIIPDPYSPLSYDRYAYANNSPINHNDPSGHCADQDTQCISKLKEIEKLFGIFIDDTNKLWTIISLESIQKGMQPLMDRMGKNGFSKQFADVKFIIAKGKQLWTSGNHDIFIGDQVINDRNYIEKYTSHELAHIWDNNCDDCLSRGLVNATNGRQDSVFWLINFDKGLFFQTELTDYKPNGQTPTSNAKNNRREDWADSVMAVLIPNSAEFIVWDQKRIDFVNKALDDSK